MSDPHFVARDAELARLGAFWADALAGRTRFCFVTGEPGAGKSAMVQAFASTLPETDPAAVTVVGACDSQTGKCDPYLPFLMVVDQMTGGEATPAQPQGEENGRRLRLVGRVAAKMILEHAPDLIGAFIPAGALLGKAAVLAIEESGLLEKLEEKKDEPATLDQEKIFRDYGRMLERISAHAPLVLVLEDLQWADSASIGLLFHLARTLTTARVLVVGTYRPNDVALGRDGERHPLEAALNEIKRHAGDVWLDLDADDPAARRAFVDAFLDTEPNLLGTDFRDALFGHTAGHALFTVELLRTLQERGGLVKDAEGRWTVEGPLDWSDLPSRVEGVVEERIGRLEEKVREILTVACVEGPSFTAQLVARVQEMRERDLLKILSGELEKRHRLVIEGASERVGTHWVSQYAFSHVLVQQYLYNDLSHRERMLLHADVATILEELFEDDRARIAVQLARHYELAGEPEKSLDHDLAAAKRALAMSAYVEARRLLEHARGLLDQIPKGGERDRRELEVLTLLANVLNAVEGWDSPAVIAVYERSRALCESLGERTRLSRILFGLWTVHLLKLELEAALSVCREYFDLADSLAQRDAILQAHAAMGNTLYWIGEAEESWDYSQAAIELFDPEIEAEHIERFGQDARVLPLMFLAQSAWLVGRHDEALAHVAEGLRVGDALKHPFSQAFALYTAAELARLRRDPAAAARHADALAALCQEHGFPFYLGLAVVQQGWAMAMRGKAAEGAARVREGFAIVASHGGRVAHSAYCVTLADARLAAGDAAGARDAADLGLTVGLECNERVYEAELVRLRGEALLALGDRAGGEAELERAVEAARARDGTMLLLRALASLARAQLARGDEGAAVPVALELSEVLARLEGGADLPDVREARSLLAALLPDAPPPAAPFPDGPSRLLEASP